MDISGLIEIQNIWGGYADMKRKHVLSGQAISL